VQQEPSEVETRQEAAGEGTRETKEADTRSKEEKEEEGGTSESRRAATRERGEANSTTVAEGPE
jgi:hypothetical protein